MEKKKLTPFQMVVRELAAERGSMSEGEYEASLMGLFDLLQERAIGALTDPDGTKALAITQQYCAFGELVNTFGTALIAFEDIEEADVPAVEIPDEPQDVN